MLTFSFLWSKSKLYDNWTHKSSQLQGSPHFKFNKARIIWKADKNYYENDPYTIFTFGLSTPNRAVQYTSVIKDLNGIISLILKNEKKHDL